MLRLGQQEFSEAKPAVMAIINRTSDSFYPGNRYASLPAALTALASCVHDGADLIDVGAVRAGAEGPAVSAVQEYDVLAPFIEQLRLRYPDLVLSIDTWRAEVIDRLRWAAVDLVNDTWAGHDRDLVHVAAEVKAGYVCSHTGGLPPRTDPVNPTYPPEPDGIVTAVCAELAAGAARAEAAGVPAERILLDPTLDFGKNTDHSLALLRHSAAIVELGYPVLQAISRKDFVGETLDLPVDERLEGSLAATAIAAWLGVSVFRTHDVRATRRVLDMVSSIKGARAPAVRRRARLDPN